MTEQGPFAPPARTAQRNTVDVSGLTQIASELQRRLHELTSIWSGAPVEVHRIQETVSRASVVLQSIVRSGTEVSLDGTPWARKTHQRPIFERLCGQLAITKEALQGLIAIL